MVQRMNISFKVDSGARIQKSEEKNFSKVLTLCLSAFVAGQLRRKNKCLIKS